MIVIIRELSVADAVRKQKLIATLKKIRQTIQKKWPDRGDIWILSPGSGDQNRVIWLAQSASAAAREQFLKEFVADEELVPLRDEYKSLVTGNMVGLYSRIDPLDS